QHEREHSRGTVLGWSPARATQAPVAQGIEHRPPEAGAQVRILPGVPISSSPFPRHHFLQSVARPGPPPLACRDRHAPSPEPPRSPRTDTEAVPMSSVLAVLEAISDFVWGPYLLIPLLIGTGLYLTVRLGGLQFIRLGAAMRLGVLKRKDAGADAGDISQFQALTTALAATVGAGNIVGVDPALRLGGPGGRFGM